MKKIIVACGGAVATSTVAADAIRDLCAQNGIKAEVTQMRDVPYVNGMAFLTGINKEATEEKILSYLKD